MSKPDIKPIAVRQYEVKQSPYERVPEPPCRSILLGASASCKWILLQNLTLDIYRVCSQIICIFSPSINVDHTWLPVTSYLNNKICLPEDEPQKFVNSYWFTT